MKARSLMLCFFVFLLAACASGGSSRPTASGNQQALKSHPAQAKEMLGLWRFIDLPADKQHKVLPKDPFPGACKFAKITTESTMTLLQLTPMAGSSCPRNRAETVGAFATVASAPPYTWSKFAGTPGGYAIEDPKSGTNFIWKLDKVEADLDARSRIGLELKAGDVILQVMMPLGNNNFAPAWGWVLRPVTE